MRDIYGLQRFIDAQDKIYASVLDELRLGQKYGCWMWYIFPQIKGLGESYTSQIYAISSQKEAKAYIEHPILGYRLLECTQLVLNIEGGRTAEQIFHYPDYLKFRSCMTLFEITAIDSGIFRNALLKYFDGKPDQLTLDALKTINILDELNS